MLRVRKAADRGRTRLPWLDSRHTFSFADYHDPACVHFGPLRVVNDDRVSAGRGFDTHPHRDMEILSYVVEGALAHADSMGNGSTIVPGEVQRMSAGTGVTHSERNASDVEPVHFLQIWILPERPGGEPGYEQRAFAPAARHNALCLVASRDGREGSLTVRQDVAIWSTTLDAGAEVAVPLAHGRRAWVQVVRGAIAVNDVVAETGDGVAVAGEHDLTLKGREPAEVLVFDLP